MQILLTAALLLCEPLCAPQEPDFAPGGPIPDSVLGEYYVAMSVAVDGEDQGVMTFAFWPEKAPATVRNFLRYCSEGWYDGLTFHRILRDFMVQGGDPTGTGAGDGKYGTIEGEFSEDPKYSHEYGVISMARSQHVDSASCQFFVVCNTGMSSWSLDGQYASFGKLTSGVQALEALANVPAVPGANGEPSKPTKKVTVTKATVEKGEPPRGETVARPAPDLGGEPARIEVQHVLIAFQGAQRATTTRSKEDAEKLANEILAKAQAGEDFTALVRAHSDDPIQPGDPNPGVYELLNRGVTDIESERKMYRLQKEWNTYREDLIRQVDAKVIDQAEAQKRMQAFGQQLQERAQQLRQSFPREQMVPAFGNVGFKLEVGEVGLAPHDAKNSPSGWHVIKRIK